MEKAVPILIAMCLVYQINSQSLCGEGYFQSSGGSDPDKAKCSVCHPICVTCTNATQCATYISSVKGIDGSNVPKCYYAGFFGYSHAYNSNTDSCDRCADGCSSCLIDYDICADCKAGWDLDRKNFKCVRATVGLAATVFVLVALTVLTAVASCLCICKN